MLVLQRYLFMNKKLSCVIHLLVAVGSLVLALDKTIKIFIEKSES